MNLTLTNRAEPEAPKDPAKKKEICSMPVVKGTCGRLILRYYFNSRTNRCEEFIYSGCGGNENNFIHGDHCVSFCNASGTDVLVSFGGPVDRRGHSFGDWFGGAGGGSLFPMIPPQTYDAFNPFDGRVNTPVMHTPRGSYFDDDVNGYVNGGRDVRHSWGGRPVSGPPTQVHNGMSTPRMASACYMAPDFSRCPLNAQQYTAYYYDSTRRMCQQYIYRGCSRMANSVNSGSHQRSNGDVNDMNGFFSMGDIPTFNNDDFMNFAASNQMAPMKNLFASVNQCLATCPAVTVSYPPSSAAYLRSRNVNPFKLTNG